jgi:hypothetical protein
MRASVAQAKSVRGIEMLKHSEELGIRKDGAATGLILQYPSESSLDCFVLVDASAWNKIDTLCWLVCPQRHKYFSFAIANNEVDRNKRRQAHDVREFVLGDRTRHV